MFNLIEKLRSKPDGVKNKIAFLTAFAFVGIIFVVWLSVIYPDFIDNSKKEQVTDEPSPVSAFATTFFAGLSSIGDKFSEIKESILLFSGTTLEQ